MCVILNGIFALFSFFWGGAFAERTALSIVVEDDAVFFFCGEAFLG